MAQGRGAWREARLAFSKLLREDNERLRDDEGMREHVLVAQDDVEMAMPVRVGDYTDFYASIHHATNVGSMFRPDNPLLPNYTHLPVGYHGRASSLVVSGSPVVRPMGQTIAQDADAPTFGPCKLLDYEMEMGFYCGGGNPLGQRIGMHETNEHIFGMCIVNDWSARDVQKWEYQPLGPFNAKNFCTTVSPWVVTMEALEPYRVPGPPRGDEHPKMLGYLEPVGEDGVDIRCEVLLASEPMREQGTEPLRLSEGGFREMFWTINQMLAHHTSTGCNVRPGDLMASGTVSGPEKDQRGCLLELTWRGQEPIQLPDGTERKFLQDGDEVIMRAWGEREGAARIGFGECRGVVMGTR
jgi:fumarylacetoacetase